MIEFLIQHQFWAAVGITWIFSAAVSAMPDPGPNARPGYLWLYRFVHTIAGNITTAMSTAARYRACASPGNRIPGLKILLPSLLVPLMFCTTACAAHYRIHPGALNQTDAAAYDTLLIAETVIDQARLDPAALQKSLGSDECDSSRKGGGEEMNPLITHLVQTAIYIATTQLKSSEVTDTLLDIIQTGVEAYEEHTGQPLDPALIKVEDPI